MQRGLRLNVLGQALAGQQIFRCFFLANKPGKSEHLFALFGAYKRANRTEHLEMLGLLVVTA